jgi:hypothetical protein
MEVELAGIRYKIVNGLINDESIQSKEDLTELKQVFKSRFILFQKMREILHLDPREPQLSPQDLVVIDDGMYFTLQNV